MTQPETQTGPIMKKNEIYQKITDFFVAKLTQGVIPWQKPWNAIENAPRNISGHIYRGVNIWLLLAQDYQSPLWLTFNQATKLGGKIKRGEKGTIIVFWKIMKYEATDTAPEKTIPYLRYYYVFNVEQTEGIPPEKLPKFEQPEKLNFTPIENCENIIEQWDDKPNVYYGGDRAYYSPTRDYIQMPNTEDFLGAEEYYSTLFHEYIHSTGHHSRTHRHEKLSDHRFGSRDYSQEELVAELGAAFMCGMAGIENKTIENSAAYIQSWIKAFKNDPAMLLNAAGQAQKACDYILQAETVTA